MKAPQDPIQQLINIDNDFNQDLPRHHLKWRVIVYREKVLQSLKWVAIAGSVLLLGIVLLYITSILPLS